MSEPTFQKSYSHQAKRLGILLLCCLFFAGCIAIVYDRTNVDPHQTWQDSPNRAQHFFTVQESQPGEGDDHIALRNVMDSPGISNPRFAKASEVDLPGTTPVIGVVVGGLAVACVVDAMADEQHHILNTVLDGRPISITYCSLAKCTRVLTVPADDAPRAAAPIDLRLGGLDENMQMVFLLGKSRFGQESTKLPLQDYGYETTTLDKWLVAHPASRVYAGELMKTPT